MKEGNLTRFYLTRYFFLLLFLSQWLCAFIIFFQHRDTKKFYVGIIFMLVGVVFLLGYYFVVTRLKRVDVGKHRIAIRESNKIKTYKWTEVKYIKAILYLNFYRLKLRGDKRLIYFIASRPMQPLYGLFPSKLKWINRLKKGKK